MTVHKKTYKLGGLINTGFSQDATKGLHITNKQGVFNVKKVGVPFWKSQNLYHNLITMPFSKFIFYVLATYFSINFFFAWLYFLLGLYLPHDFILAENVGMSKFWESFFFSAQTLTTLGYGHEYPFGLYANIISSIEALVGILLFSLMTGLMYGRFSRPKAYLQFSKNILIAPYTHTQEQGKALMFRLASYKKNALSDVEVSVILAMNNSTKEGELTKSKTSFYTLDLEIKKIITLSLSWTVVHAIDEDSPLYGLTLEEIKQRQVEVIVFIKAYADYFSSTVEQRSAYHVDDFVYNAKFLPMFYRQEHTQAICLDLAKIDDFEFVAS